jgi:ABC-type transport system substrate-binding protein
LNSLDIEVEKWAGVKVMAILSPGIGRMMLNLVKPGDPADNRDPHPILGDIRVRQAISYAIHYDELIRHVEKGRAKRLTGTMMEGFPGFDPNLFKYSLDLEKAKPKPQIVKR